MADEYPEPEIPEEAPEQPLSSGSDLKDLTDLDESRLYAAMCYVVFLVFVPLLTRRADPFINFHIRQGLIVLVGIILSLIAAAWSPVIGSLLFLLLLVADVVALVLALQGRMWKIPGLGQLAERIRI